MIIKFKTGDVWALHDGIEHMLYGAVNEDDYTQDDIVARYAPPSGVDARPCDEVAFMMQIRGFGKLRVIHAYRPIYILNDGGKTIETI